jgi:hypothetical protein
MHRQPMYTLLILEAIVNNPLRHNRLLRIALSGLWLRRKVISVSRAMLPRASRNGNLLPPESADFLPVFLRFGVTIAGRQSFSRLFEVDYPAGMIGGEKFTFSVS